MSDFIALYAKPIMVSQLNQSKSECSTNWLLPILWPPLLLFRFYDCCVWWLLLRVNLTGLRHAQKAGNHISGYLGKVFLEAHSVSPILLTIIQYISIETYIIFTILILKYCRYSISFKLPWKHKSYIQRTCTYVNNNR